MRLYLLIIIYCLGTLKGFSQDTLQHSLLWKISGNGLKQPSYLYGTMHSLCKKDIKLKPKLINVLNQAYTLVFECNFKSFDPYKTDNTVFIFNVPRDMTEEDYMHNKNSLENILDPEKFNFINKFFKDSLRVGRGVKPFNFFQPLLTLAIVKSSMLDCSTSSYEEVIGHKMADVIYQYKGLETPREIAAVGHRYKTYEVLANDLFETVKNYKALKVKSRQEYKTIVAQYNAEDINQFKINKESEEDRVFVIERNLKWMPKIEQMIKKHITVIAVGAGHLAGENGLIDLLKAKGYSVMAVLE